MASAVHAVSAERHAGMFWRPLVHYRHAQNRLLVGIAPSELGQAVHAFPLAFVQQDDVVGLVAVLGIGGETNMFVASDGTWLGRYVPAMLRAHPFAIAENEGKQILCIDEAQGLAGEDEEGKRPFFDEAGALAKPTADVVQFLQNVNAQLQRSSQLAAVLLKHDLLEPWPIEIKGAAGQAARSVAGLMRVKEAALATLSDAAFLEMRGGALLLAHAQLLSMSNLQLLPRIAQARQLREQQIQQRRQEEAALFQPSGGNQDVIDWDRMFND
ncbi:SapC family protein [Devosia submarina]|uniref:SapC family protein n=1 Tax=Devosia submarina TaxID=1173082 RepID=UPI000D3B5E45|nr:SapC family protein [Devosia submarina]